jgi:hypothetical protein
MVSEKRRTSVRQYSALPLILLVVPLFLSVLCRIVVASAPRVSLGEIVRAILIGTTHWITRQIVTPTFALLLLWPNIPVLFRGWPSLDVDPNRVVEAPAIRSRCPAPPPECDIVNNF